MRVLYFKEKILITFGTILMYAIYLFSSHQLLILYPFLIRFFAFILCTLFFHYLCVRSQQDQDSLPLVSAILFFLETACASIIFYDISSTILWIVFPFLYILEYSLVYSSETNRIQLKHYLIIFSLAFITYFTRNYINYSLSSLHNPILDILFFIGAISIIFFVMHHVQKEASHLNNTIITTKDISYRDGLTNLYNHAALEMKLEKGFSNINGVSLMMIDIDNFKNVNDTYGHTFGDTVLVTFSNVLRAFSNKKVIPYRFGGEEFSVVCTGMEYEDVLALAEMIRKKFNAIPYELNNEIKHFSISIGVAHASYKEYETIKDFIAACDLALYEAKNTGKNKVVSK